MKDRKDYPTDVTDKQWALIERLLPEQKTGRPRKYSQRDMFDAIAYISRTGCSWRMMPHDLPPWQAVYAYFRKLHDLNLWERLNDQLREQLRVELGRESDPSLIIIDSQSVKTAEKGGQEDSMVANGSKVANGN